MPKRILQNEIIKKKHRKGWVFFLVVGVIHMFVTHTFVYNYIIHVDINCNFFSILVYFPADHFLLKRSVTKQWYLMAKMHKCAITNI